MQAIKSIEKCAVLIHIGSGVGSDSQRAVSLAQRDREQAGVGLTLNSCVSSMPGSRAHAWQFIYTFVLGLSAQETLCFRRDARACSLVQKERDP